MILAGAASRFALFAVNLCPSKIARELLLKAMDAFHLEEPNSELLFGFGLIAEQYGVIDAARQMYSRVEKPELDYPASSYSIAQQHLALLKTGK